MKCYRLNEEKEPIPCTILEAGRVFEDGDSRKVAVDVIGSVRISTVFLCFDHGFNSEKPPVLWETMIFLEDSPSQGNAALQELKDYQERYSSHEDALQGHKAAVEQVRKAMGETA